MDKTPATPGDRDPVERVLCFLFRNGILLISFPVIAAVLAFVLTLGAPRTYTASFRIPSPPSPIVTLNELWSNTENLRDFEIAPDGSLLLTTTAATEPEARKPVDAALAAVRVVAAEAMAYSEERQVRIAEMETRLLDQSLSPDPTVLADQASALSLVIAAGGTTKATSNSLWQWAQKLDEQKVTVTTTTDANHTVPFAAFGAFTLALAIAVVKRLVNRQQDDGQAG
jgi:hypothetical protein